MKKQISKSIQEAVNIVKGSGGEVSDFAIEQMQRKQDGEITHAEYVELIVENAKCEHQNQNLQRVSETAAYKVGQEASVEINYSSLSGEYDFEDDD